MNKENIKIGEKYFIRAKVIGISEHGAPKVCVLNHDIYCFPDELYPITPSKPPTLVGTSPKYDPCRRFRKGDKVRVVKCNGRFPYIGWKHILNQCYTVNSDEVEFCKITLDLPEAYCPIDAAYLELVTPVEEMERYYIEKHGEKSGGLCYTVHKRGGYAEATFYFGACRTYTEAQAKARAEAERDRLNAEYRKEQSNET